MRYQYLLEDLVLLKRFLCANLEELVKNFEKAVNKTLESLKEGGKIIVFGNGGSAADAEHLVCELVGKFGFDRHPIPAITLTQPSTTVTAIANDYNFEYIFSRQLLALAKKNDIAIAISTSGKSPNVIAAAKTAKEIGLFTIALTGKFNSPLSEIADITLKANYDSVYKIQEMHGIIIHSFCRALEAELFQSEYDDKITPIALPVNKILHINELIKSLPALKKYKLVFTNGCFDILHAGHFALLNYAKSLGDILIVGLNSDESVKRLKGKSRPYHKFEERAFMLSMIEAVDYIVGFAEDTPLELIKLITPNVLVKGSDYTKDKIIGADWVEMNGGEVVIFQLVGGHSTSKILGKNK